MDDCNYGIIIIIFYIVALTFVMKTHYHYIGYIMLLIVYLINILYIIFTRGFNLSDKTLFKVGIFLIVFFSLYSLITMIDTYNYLIAKNKTYDIKLSNYHKNNVNRFNITFIIANVLLMVFLMLDRNSSVQLSGGLLATSFITMLLQIGFATSFSGMKYDFISKYSRDIQSKYENWKDEQK